jgi:CheY-like chemotaxis protein
MQRSRRPRGSHAGSEADIRILTVDDHRVFLDALRDLIAVAPGFLLVGEASSGEEAVRTAGILAPELVLMDVAMPGMGGVAAAHAIVAQQPEVAVVLVSVDRPASHPDDDSETVPFVRKQDLRPGLLGQLWEQHRPEDPA